MCHRDKRIYELTLEGNLVNDYDISTFLPQPMDPQGLTFAPSSDPNDDPGKFHLYIVDGQVDNVSDPDKDRDGIVYEAEIFPFDIFTDNRSKMVAQNYPNPFNSETQILFQVPEAAHVIIKILNVRGQEIRTLLERSYSVGIQSARWNGEDNHGDQVPSGVYFYQLQVGAVFQVRKMALLR